MIRLAVLFFASILWLAPAHAGTTEFSAEPGFLLAAPTDIVHDLSIETSVGYVGEADFTNGLGRVSVLRGGISADYSIFNLSYVQSNFFWDNESRVARTFSTRGGGTPWDTLHDVTLQIRCLNDEFAEKWRYWLNGEVSSSYEKDFPGAVGVGFDGGVAYDLWNGWMLGATAKTVAVSALSKDLFGDTEFGLTMAVSQKTLRETLKAMGVSDFSKVGSEKIGFNFALATSEKTYRLANDNTVYRNGYLGVVRSWIGAYVDYVPNDSVVISLGPEYHYNRKYKLYNNAGIHKSSHTLHNALAGYARLLWQF